VNRNIFPKRWCDRKGGAVTKNFFRMGIYLLGSAGLVSADYIVMDSKTFTYTENFSSLGTGNVTWDDGNTVRGVYLKCVKTDIYPDGIPVSLAASVGGNISAGAYNMGLPGDTDRALGWFTTSATGTGYTGIRFRDQTGKDGHTNLTIRYSFVLEQWSDRNTAAQIFMLQYKVHSAGGTTNNLISSNWTTLGTVATPVIGDGVEPGKLNGNLNQFTIAGTAGIGIRHGQFLTFRLVDNDFSGGDAMVGIDAISVSVVSPPPTE